MIPVTQTRFGYPDGNCWEACLASILEVSIDDIPDRRLQGIHEHPSNWEHVREWLIGTHGLLMIWHGESDSLAHIPHSAHGSYILSVLTSDEYGRLPHAVVAIGDKIVHNPHPGRSDWGWRGLSGVIGFEIFIPVQLARMPWRTQQWQSLDLKAASA